MKRLQSALSATLLTMAISTAAVAGDIHGVTAKTSGDIHGVKTSIAGDIHGVKASIAGDIHGLKTSILLFLAQIAI